MFTITLHGVRIMLNYSYFSKGITRDGELWLPELPARGYEYRYPMSDHDRDHWREVFKAKEIVIGHLPRITVCMADSKTSGPPTPPTPCACTKLTVVASSVFGWEHPEKPHTTGRVGETTVGISRPDIGQERQVPQICNAWLYLSPLPRESSWRPFLIYHKSDVGLKATLSLIDSSVG